MSGKASPHCKPEQRTYGEALRPWHLRTWSGITVGGWMRVLARNRWRISLTRIPMAMILTALSVMNTCLGFLQALFYSRRVARTELVEAPIFVIGHWRSGTTLLHELLVCDPRHTYPDTYSCFAPSHFLLSERLFKWLIRFFLPPQRPMDNMAVGVDNPQEDEWALCNLGLPSPYFTILFPNQPPQDPEYLDLRDVPAAGRERWKRLLGWFLRCLTVRNAKRIVLKTPLHTARIRTLLEAFPGCRFVHIVRNPFVIFPSTVHTWRKMYRDQGLQVPRYAGLEEYVLAMFSRMYAAFEEDVGAIPAGRYCEIRYEDLVRDPVGEMEAVYAQLELGDFEPARPGIERYAARTSDYQTSRYEIADEVRQAITARWAGYIEKYGYADQLTRDS